MIIIKTYFMINSEGSIGPSNYIITMPQWVKHPDDVDCVDNRRGDTWVNSPMISAASSQVSDWVIIGIDHDTVCAGVVGTAIRYSTSCAGRRAAAPAGTTSAVPDCSTNHDSADRISGQFLFYHDHNLQKVRETCVFDVLYRCSSPSAFA